MKIKFSEKHVKKTKKLPEHGVFKFTLMENDKVTLTLGGYTKQQAIVKASKLLGDNQFRVSQIS